jgi:hypothetical protein
MSSPVVSELHWNQLFSRMKDRQVIPVVGPDAVVVEDENGPCTLNTFLARRVEASLGLTRTAPPEPVTLHDVACRYLHETRGQDLDDLYSAVFGELARANPAVPAALLKLARIDAFTLYVTTTFDDLLRKALEQERPGGRRPRSFAYSPTDVEDLPAPVARLDAPAVYHLLGRVSALPEYVVTEEDTLEFVHSLQSENRRPKMLVDEIRSHSLLVIGSGYSGWLMRFFLRATKPERLLSARSKTMVVEAAAPDGAALADFLRYFSTQTRVFTAGAVEFIDELSERWEAFQAANPNDDEPAPRPGPGAGQRPADDAVFVSYAHEDRPRAERLAEALHGAGVPVWFDRDGGLQGGDDWNREITLRIRSASLFAPILSRNVLGGRRYFRAEWKAAFDEERRSAENQSFIVPIRVDDVAPDAEGIPERFRALHWLDTANGSDYGAAALRLRDLYREYQRTLGGTP